MRQEDLQSTEMHSSPESATIQADVVFSLRFWREDTMYYLSELLVAAATIGSWIHMFQKGSEKLLSRRGLSSLKYYTTLSNLFAGIVSLLILLHVISGGKGSVSPRRPSRRSGSWRRSDVRSSALRSLMKKMQPPAVKSGRTSAFR